MKRKRDYTIPIVPECLSLRPNWLPTTAPLPQASVSPPPNTSLRVGGRWEPIWTTGEKAWHSVSSLMLTYFDWPRMHIIFFGLRPNKSETIGQKNLTKNQVLPRGSSDHFIIFTQSRKTYHFLVKSIKKIFLIETLCYFRQYIIKENTCIKFAMLCQLIKL